MKNQLQNLSGNLAWSAGLSGVLIALLADIIGKDQRVKKEQAKSVEVKKEL